MVDEPDGEMLLLPDELTPEGVPVLLVSIIVALFVVVPRLPVSVLLPLLLTTELEPVLLELPKSCVDEALFSLELPLEETRLPLALPLRATLLYDERRCP
jgi:hypothetical protein